MFLKEMQEKANFIDTEYLALAKKINKNIIGMTYVYDSNTYEEILVIEYKGGYTKKLCITCDSLKAIVWDTIIKL